MSNTGLGSQPITPADGRRTTEDGKPADCSDGSGSTSVGAEEWIIAEERISDLKFRRVSLSADSAAEARRFRWGRRSTLRRTPEGRDQARNSSQDARTCHHGLDRLRVIDVGNTAFYPATMTNDGQNLGVLAS